MIVIWMIFSVAYRKAKVTLQKGRNGEKDSLSENTEGKHMSVLRKEDSGQHSPTQDHGWRDMSGHRKKTRETHSLPEQRRLSRHGKKGTGEGHSLAREGRGQD